MATKFPSVSATSMDIGDISIGEDGQQYIVASSGKGSKTKNVWKLYEPEEVIPEIVEPLAPVVAPAPLKKEKKPKKESDKPVQEVVPVPVPEPVKEELKESDKGAKEVKKEKKTKKEKVEKVEKEEKVEKTKRLPNEYNRFISTKMAEYRESHPEITNGREKMKMAASEWKALKA
jgi:hypothetical protein